MPRFYGRSRARYRKAPYRRRKGFMHRRYSVADIAQSAWKGVKMLKGLVNTEKHYLDTAISTATSSAGSVTLISGVAQGDDVNNRQGNSVLGKSMYCSYSIARNAANTNVANNVRIVVFKDLSNIGTTPTVGDILASASVIAPLNVDHTSRYQILRDDRIALTLNGSGSRFSKHYIRVNDHLKFTGSLATDVYTNALYVLVITDQASSQPTFDANYRFGFYDN